MKMDEINGDEWAEVKEKLSVWMEELHGYDARLVFGALIQAAINVVLATYDEESLPSHRNKVHCFVDYTFDQIKERIGE